MRNGTASQKIQKRKKRGRILDQIPDPRSKILERKLNLADAGCWLLAAGSATGVLCCALSLCCAVFCWLLCAVCCLLLAGYHTLHSVDTVGYG
jgi:hypothetical protein